MDLAIHFRDAESSSISMTWTIFVSEYDTLLAESSTISFVATFSGSRRGAVRIAIDRMIRRVLSAFGLVRHDQLVGLATRRSLREM